jgi:hypothetical protein
MKVLLQAVCQHPGVTMLCGVDQQSKQDSVVQGRALGNVLSLCHSHSLVCLLPNFYSGAHDCLYHGMVATPVSCSFLGEGKLCLGTACNNWRELKFKRVTGAARGQARLFPTPWEDESIGVIPRLFFDT